MKKLHALWALLALLLFSFSFTACSDDDDDEVASSSIQGKWVSDTIDGWEKENGKIVDETHGKNDFLMLDFNAQGVGKVYMNDNGHWVLDDETEKVVLQGKKFVIYTVGEEPTVATVLSLNKKTLVIESKEKWTEENGIVYESYDKIVFKKK